MRYEKIFADFDTNESLSKKLAIYRYDLSNYIFLFLLVIPWQGARDNKKRIKQQLKRLKKLKERTINTLIDIQAKINYNPKYSESFEDEKKRINKSNLIKMFYLDLFSTRIDNFIEFKSEEPHKYSIRPLIDYTIGAILSQTIRDGRGPRWEDIYELIRWVNMGLIKIAKNFGVATDPNTELLHTNQYDWKKLKDEAKYILKNHKQFIDEKTKKSFPKDKTSPFKFNN